MTTIATRHARRTWTYADYCRIPEDGKRHEIIDGRHFVIPTPELIHQHVVLAIASELHTQIDDGGRGQVYVGPVDLHLVPGTVVQPDVLGVTSARLAIVGRKKITGIPGFVVEVLAQSTWRRDRSVKRDRYERAGVAEYLIVDPKAHTLEQFVLRDGRYLPARVCTDRLELVTFPGVAIDLREIW